MNCNNTFAKDNWLEHIGDSSLKQELLEYCGLKKRLAEMRKAYGMIPDFDEIWGPFCVKREEPIGNDAIRWRAVWPKYFVHKRYAVYSPEKNELILGDFGRTCFAMDEIEQRFGKESSAGKHAFYLARLGKWTGNSEGPVLFARQENEGEGLNPFRHMYHCDAPIFGESDKKKYLAGTHHHYKVPCSSESDALNKVKRWFETNIPPEDAILYHWVP